MNASKRSSVAEFFWSCSKFYFSPIFLKIELQPAAPFFLFCFFLFHFGSNVCSTFFTPEKKTVLSILCPSPRFFFLVASSFSPPTRVYYICQQEKKSHSSFECRNCIPTRLSAPTPDSLFFFFLLPVSLAPHILNEFLSCLTLLGLCRMKRCLLCIFWLKCVYSRGINAVTDRAE